MAYINFSRELLDKFCMEAFQKFGFTKDESRIISDVLLMSDDFGIESHGMQRLVRYHKGIESGLISVFNSIQRAESILCNYPKEFRSAAVIPLLDLAQRQYGKWCPLFAFSYSRTN